jgi:hypothetical protein
MVHNAPCQIPIFKRGPHSEIFMHLSEGVTPAQREATEGARCTSGTRGLY